MKRVTRGHKGARQKVHHREGRDISRADYRNIRADTDTERLPRERRVIDFIHREIRDTCSEE